MDQKTFGEAASQQTETEENIADSRLIQAGIVVFLHDKLTEKGGNEIGYGFLLRNFCVPRGKAIPREDQKKVMAPYIKALIETGHIDFREADDPSEDKTGETNKHGYLSLTSKGFKFAKTVKKAGFRMDQVPRLYFH